MIGSEGQAVRAVFVDGTQFYGSGNHGCVVDRVHNHGGRSLNGGFAIADGVVEGDVAIKVGGWNEGPGAVSVAGQGAGIGVAQGYVGNSQVIAIDVRSIGQQLGGREGQAVRAVFVDGAQFHGGGNHRCRVCIRLSRDHVQRVGSLHCSAAVDAAVYHADDYVVAALEGGIQVGAGFEVEHVTDHFKQCRIGAAEGDAVGTQKVIGDLDVRDFKCSARVLIVDQAGQGIGQCDCSRSTVYCRDVDSHRYRMCADLIGRSRASAPGAGERIQCLNGEGIADVNLLAGRSGSLDAIAAQPVEASVGGGHFDIIDVQAGTAQDDCTRIKIDSLQHPCGVFVPEGAAVTFGQQKAVCAGRLVGRLKLQVRVADRQGRSFYGVFEGLDIGKSYSHVILQLPAPQRAFLFR